MLYLRFLLILLGLSLLVLFFSIRQEFGKDYLETQFLESYLRKSSVDVEKWQEIIKEDLGESYGFIYEYYYRDLSDVDVLKEEALDKALKKEGQNSNLRDEILLNLAYESYQNGDLKKLTSYLNEIKQDSYEKQCLSGILATWEWDFKKAQTCFYNKCSKMKMTPCGSWLFSQRLNQDWIDLYLSIPKIFQKGLSAEKDCLEDENRFKDQNKSLFHLLKGLSCLQEGLQKGQEFEDVYLQMGLSYLKLVAFDCDLWRFEKKEVVKSLLIGFERSLNSSQLGSLNEILMLIRQWGTHDDFNAISYFYFYDLSRITSSIEFKKKIPYAKFFPEFPLQSSLSLEGIVCSCWSMQDYFSLQELQIFCRKIGREKDFFSGSLEACRQICLHIAQGGSNKNQQKKFLWESWKKLFNSTEELTQVARTVVDSFAQKSKERGVPISEDDLLSNLIPESVLKELRMTNKGN